MRGVWGTLVPTGPGGRLAQRAQGCVSLPRVRQDGHPSPPHRRYGVHHQVTTEEQHPARKPRRLAPIAHRIASAAQTSPLWEAPGGLSPFTAGRFSIFLYMRELPELPSYPALKNRPVTSSRAV